MEPPSLVPSFSSTDLFNLAACFINNKSAEVKMSQDNRFPTRPLPQPAFLPRPMMMPLMAHRPDLKVPPIFYYNLDDPKVEKKWRGPKEDITDYFNYGLTEETWKILSEKVVKLADKVDKFTYDYGECVALNDRIPLEFGGFGAPYFEQTKKLPFINILKKNKERFFYQYLQQSKYDVDEVKNQLQNALTSDFVEENYYEVRAAYDAIVPDQLQLKHKLPQISHTTFYRPHPSFNRLPGQPRPSLNPLKDPAVASIAEKLQKSSAAYKPEPAKQVSQADSYNETFKNLLESAGHRFPHFSAEKFSSDLLRQEAARKKSELAERSDESRSRNRRDKDKKERTRTPKKEKEKKRKDRRSTSSRRSESRPKKKKQEKDRKVSKERAKDRESRSSSRKAKKKAKKSGKEKREDASPPGLPKNDIRQRIQPRTNK
jgi:hypothetical protein